MKSNRMNTLIAVLSDISKALCPDSSTVDDFYNQLKNIYSDVDFRHSYATISDFLVKQIPPDAREELEHNMNLILECAQNSHSSDSEIIKKIIKLKDHIELEILRILRIEQINVIGGRAIAESKRAEDLINDNNLRIEKQRNEIKSLKEKLKNQAQKSAESSITILGIFVGIVMVFFGGFTILENAIEGMQKASSYRLYFTMLLFGAIMYNVVILLFFLISRITEKPVTCRCHRAPGYGSLSGDGEKVFREITRNDCFNCQYRVKNKGLCRIKNTLPYVYWGNLVIIMGLSFMFFMRVFRDNSNLGKFTCCQLLLSFLIVVIEFLIACGISKLGNASQKTKQNEK